MEIDSYEPCPCGSGKKIKFCCSKDLVHDLGKVIRAMEGEQPAFAIDLLKKVYEKHGPRGAFLALECECQLAQQHFPEAEAAANKLLEVVPHSTTGSSILAILDVIHERLTEAVDHLQDGLENSGNEVSAAVMNAVYFVGKGLAQAGGMIAARAHWYLRLSLSQDEMATNLYREIAQLHRMGRLPTLLKQDFELSRCPAGVPWSGEFEAAMAPALRGCWRTACETLQALDDKVPQQAVVRRNIAILRSWLGQHEAAAAAWSRYARTPGINDADAVEAEALAQTLGPDSQEAANDLVRVRLPIRDLDRLMERLLSDKRLAESTVDPNQFQGEDNPRPKGIFALLDRPKRDFDPNGTWRDLPQHAANLFVFGRQTDREACVELYYEQGGAYGDPVEPLREILGDWIGPAAAPEKVSEVSPLYARLNPSFEFPKTTDSKWLTNCMTDHRDHALGTVWPELPRGVFGGLTARQAATDPQRKLAVEAAILNLELATDEQVAPRPFDFDALRQSLGLPTRGRFTWDQPDAIHLSVARLARLDAAAMSDESLSNAVSIANFKNLRRAQENLIRALLDRPTFQSGAEASNLYRQLSRIAGQPEEALRLLDQAREAAIAAGVSPARCYLDEFSVRMMIGHVRECERLMQIISSRHIEEPGIRESLYSILQQMGLIDRQGNPAVPVGPGPTEPAAPEPAGLWTPDAPAPKSESKLWLPGMD